MKYFLDTNICIYFLMGKYPVLIRKMMSFNPNDIKIPAIVKAELYHGAEKSLKRDENMDKNVNQIVSDAYDTWWTQNKDKDPNESMRINPLQDTNYKWL